MPIDSYIIGLSNYRLNKADENIEAAKVLFESKYYSESLNRSYYAIFHSLRALLAYNEFDSKKHSGIISYFNQYYVKNNKFSKDFSVILNEAFMIRNRSDYDDFYIASREEAKEQIEKAKTFINGIKTYIQKHQDED
ncbi:HEPN domain-containing protein [Proteiniborus sp. MB09-C3]|uniref:HEPN domain-containing protein n=1 Tax=Proteiniborus sp. MB09-C3 TaxID=3050072 RepID=UPI0025541CF2|nr:HEPN domain-containing protein [Proteiniborus sp. MB09-C3]WIV13448.1 HEPN domain-containing protein [Proteiniborus sp. MB09-C3]